jgi:hypothetical protein
MVGLAAPVVIFFGDVRFHLPVMPLLLIAAAVTIVAICTNVGESNAEGAETTSAPVSAPAT